MTNSVQTYKRQQDSASISLTPAAIAHIQRYLAKQDEAKHLRISVKTAGCNGLQYVYDIVAAGNPDDYQLPQGEFTVFVAQKSMPFIKGSIFDYIETGLQKGWLVKNPQEAGSCGCGESFTVDPDLE